MAVINLNCRCRNCGEARNVAFEGIINVASRPELKEKVAGGDYFTWECPHCGARNLITSVPCLYHDAGERLMLVLSAQGLRLEDIPEGYTCRLVDSVGQLIEKVRIAGAGLDDVVMELCKYITAQELRKDVDLKFVKTDGADSEISFTYPQNGEMEMIAVGFNVYEDCAGIVSRNPSLQEAAKACVNVNKEWISRFFA